VKLKYIIEESILYFIKIVCLKWKTFKYCFNFSHFIFHISIFCFIFQKISEYSVHWTIYN